MPKPLQIWSRPEELAQGLFGQTFYHLLQILPYLAKQNILPSWDIRTLHYGDPPDKRTVPGVLDLAYEAPAGPYRCLSLAEMQRRHSHVLGNDWGELNRIWNLYFRIPKRVQEQAGMVLPPVRVLGLHYRGTDKQTTTWDSNPISRAEFISLVKDFLETRTESFMHIFVATDERAFVQQVRRSFDLPVLSLGEVEFHLSATHRGSRAEKADRALLDCLLLSRCSCVIETSSALPSFAKLLNPQLEIYRCAASKLFGKLYTNMPYFPVAHIPFLPVSLPESKAIMGRTMEHDWTNMPQTRRYQQPFTAVPRWPRNHRVFRKAERLGVDRIVARVLRGHK